jgi:hypothetical protein
MTVEKQSFEQQKAARVPQPTIITNVVATLKGSQPQAADRIYVVSGHYDSMCGSPTEAKCDAPGANDDASGTAAVLEMARVMAKFEFDATIVFMTVAGEEQGLLGSTHFAQRLHDAGYHISAAVTNDIVGNVVADDGRIDSTSVRIFGADPDNGPSRELARYTWATGTLYDPAFAVIPVFRLDRISRGGDHSPFVTLRDPGLRFTERLENYKRQHLPTDKLPDVNFGYVANVARLNAVSLGSLAMAPPPPDSVTARRDQPSGGQKWMISWKPVAGAVAYEILVRRTTSAIHEQVTRVTDTNSFLLGEQLDDMWASVRSVGANGHRSLAVVVPPPAFVTR